MNPKVHLDEVAGLLSKRPFEPHPLLREGHAQTIAGWAWPRRFGRYTQRARAREEERLFEVERGVRLLARCLWQEERTSRPTLLLVHGLGGSDASSYVLGTANLGYRAGMNMVRLNQRNCGGTEHLTPTLYHSGLSGDLRGVVDELLGRDRLPAVFVVGFSMGGNLALKMAGEIGKEAQSGLLGVCAISPIIDLSETARCIEHPSNRLYQWRFVRGLKTMALRKKELYPQLYDLRGLLRVRTVRDFDELYTAPHWGFADAEDYYAKASSLRFLADIEVPSLVLHARDDPLVPYAPLSRSESWGNPSVLVAAPSRGGHVGFVSREGGRERFWAEGLIVWFCELLSARFFTGETPPSPA
jgi:predicted alpha/beta-fold hydrolase